MDFQSTFLDGFFILLFKGFLVLITAGVSCERIFILLTQKEIFEVTLKRKNNPPSALLIKVFVFFFSVNFIHDLYLPTLKAFPRLDFHRIRGGFLCTPSKLLVHPTQHAQIQFCPFIK